MKIFNPLTWLRETSAPAPRRLSLPRTAAALLLLCFAAPSARAATNEINAGIAPTPPDENFGTFLQSQADRLKNPKTLDVLIFPSYVDFGNAAAQWGDPCSEKQSLSLSVNPTVVSDAPEKTVVTALSAQVSGDGGDTWRRFEFSKNKDSGEWSATIDFPEWKTATATALPAATATAALPQKQSCPVSFVSHKKDSPSERALDAPPADICFQALDSLGNVTTQLFRQTSPESEADVLFSPFITDPAEPYRSSSSRDYRNSPDRDIASVSAAWLRDRLLFRMNINGTTVPYSTVPPGLNYYIARFIPMDESSFRIQLGTGLYHYHSARYKTSDPLNKHPNESFPFRIEYDPLNLFQLGAIIDEARQTPGFPPIFDEFAKQLEEEGLADAAGGKTTAAPRRTIFNTGITDAHIADRIYWGIDTAAFTSAASEESSPEDAKQKSEREIRQEMEMALRDGRKVPGGRASDAKKLPPGVIVRFYTAYKLTELDENIVRDDTTAYATVLFSHLALKRGQDLKPEKRPEKTPPPARPWRLDTPAPGESQNKKGPAVRTQ